MHIPPFCPNPACRFHPLETETTAPRFWIRAGRYRTKVSGVVQRFICRECGRGFSERTFSIDYYTKKTLNYREIHRATVSAESLSSIARHLDCSLASVQNRQDRLGRNCLAMQARLLTGHELSEDLCADAFESFDRSQYFPNAINILVGIDSQFLYGYTHATMRRKGRMTYAQKRKRDAYDSLLAPKKGMVTRSFSELLENIEPVWNRKRQPRLILRTDEHPAYPQAITRLPFLHQAIAVKSFVHESYSSKAARTLANPLFPVNYFDRELRKDIAAYRRESTCFTRNVANGLLRLSQYQQWHNFQKPHRIVSAALKPQSHAIVAGIEGRRIDRESRCLYIYRAFFDHQRLSDEFKKTWLKGYRTPLKVKADYCPLFAAQGHMQAS